ncbi:MAG: PAS domain-containing sensor histidine kinase [Pseudomonadota bacterium]
MDTKSGPGTLGRDTQPRSPYWRGALLFAVLALAGLWAGWLGARWHAGGNPWLLVAGAVAGLALAYAALQHGVLAIWRRQMAELDHARLMLQHAGQGIYGLDAEGRAIYVNPAAEHMLGFAAPELLGRILHDLIHGRHADGSAHPMQDCPVHRAMRDGVARRVDDDVFWRRDGTPLQVSYVAAPLVQGGRIAGAVVLFDDVGESRRAERRLRESEAGLARAQAQAKLGSWHVEVAENRLTWSEESRRIFAAAPDVVLDYAFFLSRVHPADRARVDAAWQAALNGAPYDIQHRLLLDGRVLWVRERAELEFDDAGRPLRGVGTVQDITELKQKEEELLRSRQMVRDLAAHSDRIREVERARIAREIHDELGQYLTALRMDVAMLGIRHGAGNPELAEQARVMKETIDTTIGVVRQVAAALRPGALDMGLASAAEWLLANFQARTGVRCTLESPAEDLALDDDRTTAVFRILQESLTNIARHAEAAQVRVRLTQEEGELCVQVEDDGQGFDTRAVREKKTFGLMGIRERAIAFGGESRLDSQPGRGTTLTVRIPLSGHEPSADDPSPPTPRSTP